MGGALAGLERYLAGLPGGLDAHPAAQAKGALVRSALDGERVEELLPLLPPPLRRLAAEPPVASEWVPEAHLGALVHAIADRRALRGAEFRSWARARHRAMFERPAYEVLMAVASPAALVRFADRRWANWHRGTALAVEGFADDGVRIALSFPAGLYDDLLLASCAEAFAAALELAHAPAPAVALEAGERGRVRFLARW